MKRNYRTLIVDDEAFARRDIIRLLANFSDIEVIGEADGVAAAAAKIRALQPDLVLLDIEMQDGSGFQLFDLVDDNFKVVFITAFDNYAIRAFEVNALDYLLKPVSPTRLARTIARLQEIAPINESQPLTKPLNYDDYLFIKTHGRTGFIKVNSIVAVIANVDYSEVFTANGERRMISRSLREWEEHLPMQYFLRIHRSAIVNIEYIERVEPWSRSTYQVYLCKMTEPLVTSRRYSSELRKRFF